MKDQIKLIAIILFVGIFQVAGAQSYKASKIDASGKITDRNGKYAGTVSVAGVIKDSAGKTFAHVDANGNLVDEKTGKKLGKAEKNGNFLPAFAKTTDKGWTVSTPMNGICIVQDAEGKIMAEVHENYKAFGACAMHCVAHHMNHDEVLEKKTPEAMAYSCPMHADVKSDKPGKCSKCGMDLVKKK